MNYLPRETIQQRYQRRNKETLKQNRLHKRAIRDIKINSFILKYDKSFFKSNKPRRRGIIHSILIGEFDQECPFFCNSYADFVRLFNKACDDYDLEGELINKEDDYDDIKEEKEENEDEILYISDMSTKKFSP